LVVRWLPLFLLLSVTGVADVRECSCDVASAESMAKRECGLCREAEKQPAGTPVFFLRDINPRKPNRWLALPRAHRHVLTDFTPEERLAFWTAALVKAKELFGDHWGLAVNADWRRTQCHIHAHIGKLLDGVEPDQFVIVNGAADLPVPRDGDGFWIHPVGGKLHVHLGEEAAENVLMR
jgi:hypothetical protein